MTKTPVTLTLTAEEAEDLDERLKRLATRLKRIADHLEKTRGEA